MKYLILIINTLCLVNQGFSQDSVSVKSEMDTFKTPQYKSDYDAFFLKQQPQKFMFKMTSNTVIRDNGFTGISLTLSPEFRLAQGVSLNLGVATQSFLIYGLRYEDKSSFNFPIQLFLEPRYYFNKRKEIAKKESADNLIGAYSGLKTGIIVSPTIKGTSYFGEVVLGLQQLFYLKTNRGLYKDMVDLSVGLGALYNTDSKWKPSYHFQVQLGGFLENITKPRLKNNDLPALCDVYQCFVEEKRMLRIDLMNLLNLYGSDNLDGGLDINYEEKIGKSAFSVNFGLNGTGYNFKSNTTNNSSVKGYSARLYIESRWYFKMKKEIANGSTASNLSGVYGGLQMGYQINEKDIYEANKLSVLNKSDYFFMNSVFGQQQRILKHLFIETKGGLGLKSKKNITYLPFGNSHFNLLAEIKVGMAF
jgi:hypothetical protein